MSRDHKNCGGRFYRIDIIGLSSAYGRIMYQDTDTEKANWKCDRCGHIRTQRKRQSKKGEK